MSSALRRVPLTRLLLGCSIAVAVGVGATALALAVSAGPVPPPKPLAQAIHDALSAPRADGVSARVQLTDHLVEGANLATSGGGEASQLSQSPLLSGASGRLWIAGDGRARLELQSERGDTQLLWDGHTASMYDASTNTLYRYTPPAREDAKDAGAGGSAQDGGSERDGQPPTTAQIQQHLDRAAQHAEISPARPTDVAGQAAYTVRVSPRENGGLIAGAELSWDAVHGAPLRAAVYSTDGAAPVLELAASDISYGPVDPAVLDFTVPADATVKDVKPPRRGDSAGAGAGRGASSDRPKLTLHGKGLAAIALVESPVRSESKEASIEGLRKVEVNGASASELPTTLGTVLSFERAGVRYLLAGSVTPSAIEAFARGL